ncbi:CRISPR-associated protein Csn2-St [Nosocomiicoccus sp. HMSC059G07]|uniref:CRISPR-associated protein Csn2-St n=1 Tax=Nosocomiicoccus sp. HMSC059G07 TaxID=1739531 RepID=UPI0008A2590B|nr:CRISPR-associated protein Csn2-St [Nosocomiicoccus sp. HMSC059G07]OFO49719.1 hypothetical protein HMPREF3029_08900 [Nosocomiicoccus sp. HMSC059G07]
MTRSLIFSYSGQTYELDIDNALIFVGGDHVAKREFHKILKRFAAYGTYSPSEVSLFGEVGIEIEYDNKKLTKNENDFIFIDNLHDILHQFEYKRNSLLFNAISDYKDDYEINNIIYKVNDLLIHVENKLNQNMRLDNNRISLTLKDLTFDDIVKNLIDVNHIYNEIEVPSYFVKLEDTIDSFLALLKQRVENSSKMHWIVLNSPESIFRSEAFYYFYKKLENVAQETGRLKIIVLHYRAVPYYDLTDIESIVLAFNGFQQLPDIDSFYQSIERNYPCKLVESKVDVLNSFFRVCNFIGDYNRTYYYLMHKDMVLLYVLRDILNDDSNFEVENRKITTLEENYLKSKGFRM